MERKFEIEPDKSNRLEGQEKFFIQIPESVILNETLGDKRITALSYFLYYKNMVGNVNFSINKIVEWIGRKPNKRTGRINHMFTDAVLKLVQSNFIELYEEPSNSVCTSAVVNVDEICDRCNKEYFAIIYFDELEKILGYRNDNCLDGYMDNESVLMVFAFLRLEIRLRRNEFYENEFDVDGRRTKYPEAYDGYYCDIATMLGLSERSVSKAVDVLNDLGLIYSETLPREKDGDKWVTNATIFCNRYKRQNDFLLESGEEYYMREVENKKKKIASSKKRRTQTIV